MMAEVVVSDVGKFEAEKLAARPFFVADVLAKSRDSMRAIDPFEGMRSIDSESAYEGIATALGWDPTNLPALRLMAWKQTRAGDWAAAKETLRAIIENWPGVPDTRRELLRVNFLSPGEDGEEIFTLAQKQLHTPLQKSAYACQHMVAVSQPITKAATNELKLHIDQCCAEMFRRSTQPDGVTPTAHRRLFSQILTTLISADRIALIGNGPSLNGSGLGAEIDGHDLVIRCNFPKLAGFENDVGQKIDMIFFNEAIIRKLPEFTARNPAYSTCLSLAFHPEPSPIFSLDKYDESLSETVCLVSPVVREFYRHFFYPRPTTGLMAIILLTVLLQKDIDIYGFDFYSKGVNFFPTTSPIFLGHELQYEQWFLEKFLAWLALGKVRNGGAAKAAADA